MRVVYICMHCVYVYARDVCVSRGVYLCALCVCVCVYARDVCLCIRVMRVCMCSDESVEEHCRAKKFSAKRTREKMAAVARVPRRCQTATPRDGASFSRASLDWAALSANIYILFVSLTR